MPSDALEVKAHGLARTWGVATSTVIVRPVEPCPRPDCGGSVMVMGDDGPRRCLLCGRDGAGQRTTPADKAD